MDTGSSTRWYVKKIKIKIVFFDFDGVFTDNKVVTHDDGSESVICDKSDGVGVQLLKNNGIESIILSSEESNVVGNRAKKIGIDYYHAVKDKLLMMQTILEAKRIGVDEVAYVGNDINDIECMKNVGLSIAVMNAVDEVKEIAKVITWKRGGDGAVREVCERIIEGLK